VSATALAVPLLTVEITESVLNVSSGIRITIYNAFGNCAYPIRVGEMYLVATDYVEAPDGLWVDLPARSQAVGLSGPTKVLNSPEGRK